MKQQRLAQRHEEQRLRRLPPARPALDAHDPRVARHVRVGRRRVAPARAVRPGRRDDVRPADGLGGASFKYLGDWTERVAKGELPHAKPHAAAGRRAQHRRHAARLDEREAISARPDLDRSSAIRPSTATGRCTARPSTAPTIMPILDPVKNTATTFMMPVRDPHMPLSLGPGHAAALKPLAPSPYWGDEQIWDTRVNNHNSMLDRKGRVWLAAAVRGAGQSGVLQEGLGPSVGEAVPARSQRPPGRRCTIRRRRSTRFVDTCFGTHHLQFGYDANDTLWTSGGGPVRRLAQHQDVPRDRRRGEVAGLDGARARHQRQRQARRLRRAQQAGRSDARTSASSRRSTPSCRARSTARSGAR